MALKSALVDRARVLRYTASATKVEGSTQFTWVAGPWFRARLSIALQPEAEEPAGGRARVQERPGLLYGVRDLTGLPVAITAEDRVEVASPAYGTRIYVPDGDPEPIRKKRKVIGFNLTLRRVVDHARAVA